MSSLTATYTGAHSVEVSERTAAAPGPGEVRIAVAYVGLCGTDLHVYHGAMDSRVTRPAVLGHEMSGRIAEVGEAVEGWAVGDPITVMPLDWDGTCPACQAGHTHVCHNLNFIGIDSPGALQNTWTVAADILVALPSELRLDHAALAEPVAVAVHDVRRSGLVAGESAVVLGGGPIGTLIATVARDLGASVVIVEPDAARRGAIEALGFEVLDPSSSDTEAWVTDWTAGAGADVVFEVSGSAAAVLTATQIARVRGRVVVVAIHPQLRPLDLHRVFWRELTLLGARVYERLDVERAVELLAAGVIPADELITSIRPLSEAPEAFEALAQGGSMKILINCEG